MSTIRFGEADLLEYNADYKLLICRECQYAIQKSALESHLLRHKIYRGDRQRLLSSIANLDLFEPQDVPLPAPGSTPIDALPIFSGFRCTASECRHLTVSTKRMKRHRSEVHELEGSVQLSDAYACPVKLQTFFRGTKVRYFEVSVPVTPQDNAIHGHDDRDETLSMTREKDGCETILVPSNPPEPSNLSRLPPKPLSKQRSSSPQEAEPLGTTDSHSPADLNLETLAYFHHFMTTTSSTLPGTGNQQSSQHYWQMRVVSEALQKHWLMCGLLAIAAHHLAISSSDTVVSQTHHKRQGQFLSEFSAGADRTEGRGLRFSRTAAAVNEANRTGEQVQCLLRCTQFASIDSTLSYEAVASLDLQYIMSTIRGCIITSAALDCSSIPGAPDGCQADVQIQSPPPTRDPSHGTPSSNPSNDRVPSALLACLRTLPFSIAERIGRPESAQEVLTTLSAITTTVECCEVSFSSDETEAAWQGVAMWLTNVTKHFNQMVEHHHSAALVVLAHWAAVLVKRAEDAGCWFLKGSAKVILLQIMNQLSVSGRTVLDLVECLLPSVDD